MACVHTIHDVLVYFDAHSGCRRHIHWSTVVLSRGTAIGFCWQAVERRRLPPAGNGCCLCWRWQGFVNRCFSLNGMLTYVAGAKMAREVLVVVFLVGKSLRGKVSAIANSRHRRKSKKKKIGFLVTLVAVTVIVLADVVGAVVRACGC